MKTASRCTFVGLMLLGTAGASAHEYERIFNQASELADWCRQEAEAHFVAKGITPYQWTASFKDRGNLLHAQGKLRADGNDVTVVCRVARGAREEYAVVEIQDGR